MSEGPTPPQSGARDRIVAAARDLAAERGPRHISIESVAERAGLSKGGVLYHFRTKADLLDAIVSFHVETTRKRVGNHMAADGQNRLARALIAVRRDEKEEAAPPASGILAVLAEHPGLLDPVCAHQQMTLDTLRRDSTDPDLATIAFLALEGMRALSLFGFDILDPKAEEALLDRMGTLLTAAPLE